MSISVKVTGLNSLFKTLDKKEKNIDDVDKILKNGAFRIERDAKIKAPVDSGTLRASINTQRIKKLKWKVADGVNYGIWNEIGTRFIVGKHFLQKAAIKNAKWIKTQIANSYK